MQHSPLSYDEWKEQSKPDITGVVHLLLDGLQTIENAGLILRSAAAMDIGKVVFYRPEFQWNAPKLNTLSRSTSEQIDIEVLEEVEETASLPTAYRQVVALEYTNRSENIYNFPFDDPLLLLAGNEHRGLRPELLQHIEDAVHIPLFGHQSSINVACAVSAALGEITRQRISN